MIQKEFNVQLSDNENQILQFRDEATDILYSLEELNKNGYVVIFVDLNTEVAICNYNPNIKEL